MAWPFSTAAGRWAGFGPYYAMFPVGFAKWVVENMCPLGGAVLDPFCGRGTAPFVAQATGREAVGVDINPVAWVFAKTKTDPEKDSQRLISRLLQVCRAVRVKDKHAENEFQKWAWSPSVLGFLNAARRILNWREDTTDRTLMGLVLAHVHAKIGDGLSNQMHKARALGPDYSVRWWKSRDMRPPELNPADYLRQRIEWRYKHGVVDGPSRADIVWGAAERNLCCYSKEKFDLLLTSPPYFGVTRYRHDSWIRLWLLNEGPPLPDWKNDPNMSGKDVYREMLDSVFAVVANLLKPRGVVWVRTDARKVTKEATQMALSAHWPMRNLYMRSDPQDYRTQTSHFGDNSPKPGEVDFLIPGRNKLPSGFVLCS
ncbi:MAG: DNA methyltransferase [Candidatus Dadabacteria bacterium]|nr:DNA methyltransferase [Candidatus Dadabacteria bacterium]